MIRGHAPAGAGRDDSRAPGSPFARASARRRGLPALAVASLLFAAVQTQASKPNILLVTIDTVRADRLGAYGYARAATPAIDRLAHEGVRFADATTASPLTGPAHAAILTGDYPARYGVRDNATTPLPDQAVTLAEVLKTAGYRTGGFVGAFILGREYGFAQGFDHFDAEFSGFDVSMKLQAQRPGGEVTSRAIAWIQSVSNQPFFAWVHLYDAHAPYTPPPPYAGRFPGRPYDGEIAYVDACIARLITALAARATLDRTIVSVIADHGEGLGDHGEGEHGLFLYEPVLRVPWILRWPERVRAGAVVSEQVRSVDVLPTIAELAGVSRPQAVDGESLVRLINGQPRREAPPAYAETYYPRLHYGWSELRSIRADGWKYIAAPKPELYSMTSDPAESRNVVDARGPLAAGLLAELNRIESTFGEAGHLSVVPPDPETLARLRSLGYIGIAAPSGSGQRPDPKDMAPRVRVLNETLSRAMDDLGAQRFDQALARLKELSAINERWYDIHLLMGDAYSGKRDFDRALGEYAAAAVLNPSSAAPPLSSARALIAQGRLTEAATMIERATTLEPASSEVALEHGRLLERRQEFEAAIGEYQRAVTLNGSDPRGRARLADLALRLRRLDIAEREFNALLTMKYRLAETHYGLGRVAELRGDKPRAAALYRRALAINPALTDAREALARVGG